MSISQDTKGRFEKVNIELDYVIQRRNLLLGCLYCSRVVKILFSRFIDQSPTKQLLMRLNIRGSLKEQYVPNNSFD